MTSRTRPKNILKRSHTMACRSINFVLLLHFGFSCNSTCAVLLKYLISYCSIFQGSVGSFRELQGSFLVPLIQFCFKISFFSRSLNYYLLCVFSDVSTFCLLMTCSEKILKDYELCDSLIYKDVPFLFYKVWLKDIFDIFCLLC